MRTYVRRFLDWLVRAGDKCTQGKLLSSDDGEKLSREERVAKHRMTIIMDLLSV